MALSAPTMPGTVADRRTFYRYWGSGNALGSIQNPHMYMYIIYVVVIDLFVHSWIYTA